MCCLCVERGSLVLFVCLCVRVGVCLFVCYVHVSAFMCLLRAFQHIFFTAHIYAYKQSKPSPPTTHNRAKHKSPAAIFIAIKGTGTMKRKLTFEMDPVTSCSPHAIREDRPSE